MPPHCAVSAVGLEPIQLGGRPVTPLGNSLARPAHQSKRGLPSIQCWLRNALPITNTAGVLLVHRNTQPPPVSGVILAGCSRSRSGLRPHVRFRLQCPTGCPFAGISFKLFSCNYRPNQTTQEDSISRRSVGAVISSSRSISHLGLQTPLGTSPARGQPISPASASMADLTCTLYFPSCPTTNKALILHVNCTQSIVFTNPGVSQVESPSLSGNRTSAAPATQP